MRFSKKIVRSGVLFGACASIIFGTGVFIGACGSSDDTPANPTDQDASTEATTGDAAVAALDLQANNATVYVGQLVRLDAAQSKAPGGAAITYGWSLKSAPAGSSITTATLAGDAGASLAELMALGRWSSPQMAMRYMHENAKRSKAALKKL